ncbi:MAG: LysE family transporter [Bacteroidales bacterium]
MFTLKIFLLAIVITIIGAVPLGLVNLSVLRASFEKSRSEAMAISRGAAFVEIIFGLSAYFIGDFLSNYLETHTIVYTAIILLPALVGIFFIISNKRTRKNTEENQYKQRGFIKGLILNLVSLQVFLYWILAMAYLNTIVELDFRGLTLAGFIAGVWAGKMAVLLGYAFFSRLIMGRISFLTNHMNRVIGTVLILTTFIQLIKQQI